MTAIQIGISSSLLDASEFGCICQDPTGIQGGYTESSAHHLVNMLRPFGAAVKPGSCNPAMLMSLSYVAVGPNQWYHFGVGAPPILEKQKRGDWDVHWGYGILTRGHVLLFYVVLILELPSISSMEYEQVHTKLLMAL